MRDRWEAQKKAKRTGEQVIDFDAILPSITLDLKKKRFWQRYHGVFPPEVEPADLVVSRLANEISARQLTVRDLGWVKTMAQQIRAKRREERITEHLKHVVNELEEDTYVGDVNAYLDALWTLLIGMARAGCELLPATVPPTPDVPGVDETLLVEVPLSVVTRYWYRAKHQSKKYPAAERLPWLRENDETERTDWVDVHRNSSRSMGNTIVYVYEQTRLPLERTGSKGKA